MLDIMTSILYPPTVIQIRHCIEGATLTNQRANWVVLGVSGIWLLVAIACGWVLRHLEPGPALRLLLALLPVIPGLFYLALVFRSIRGMDELEHRVQFEAVSFAFLGSLVVSLTYGMLQKSGFFRGWPWDWEGIWFMLIGLWAVGYLRARRRYQ